MGSLEQKACAGDAAAFGQILRRYDHDLRGVVWSVVRDQISMDDVMQTAYEKAFASIKTFKGNAALKTWLHSICYRTAIDYLRYEQRRDHSNLDSLAERRDYEETSDAALVNISLADILESAEPETRALVILTAGFGYSFDEAATIVGVQRGTAASRVGRFRQQLAKQKAQEASS